MTDEPTTEQELFSKVYGHLDSTGGMFTALANALHAAGEAGHPIESHDTRRADIDNALQRAMEEMDSDDPDPVDILCLIEVAQTATDKFYRSLNPDLKQFDIPDYVDAGVYNTLGGYAEYVRTDISFLREQAERWVEAA
jgi:hypothetical protein